MPCSAHLKIPLFGREEDAADQFSTYIMLRFDKEEARRLILGSAYQYKGDLSSPTVTMAQQKFADEHGTPAQRFFNLLCMAYGADPKLFADVVDKRISARGPRRWLRTRIRSDLACLRHLDRPPYRQTPRAQASQALAAAGRHQAETMAQFSANEIVCCAQEAVTAALTAISEQRDARHRRNCHYDCVGRCGKLPEIDNAGARAMPSSQTSTPSKYDRLIARAKAGASRRRRSWCIRATRLRCAAPIEAAEAGIIDPILVGPAKKITEVARAHNLDIGQFRDRRRSAQRGRRGQRRSS